MPHSNPGDPPGTPSEPREIVQKCKKLNFYWSIAILIFWPSHESGAKTVCQLENLVWKSPTSTFDMPSSRCYEAKREKMLTRATSEEKISGSRRSGDFLFGAFAVVLRNKKYLFASSNVKISYHQGGLSCLPTMAADVSKLPQDVSMLD